jgi:hypothetical protein
MRSKMHPVAFFATCKFVWSCTLKGKVVLKDRLNGRPG